MFLFHSTVQLHVSRSVQGLTASDKDLYVLLNKCPDIGVYDAETLTYQRSIPVPGLYDPNDIVFSNNGLFVSDNETCSIRRIDLLAGEVMKWAVNGTSLTLSSTQGGNVIASSSDPSEISEYTTDGKQLWTIKSSTYEKFKNCIHAIHITDDFYLACCAKNLSNQLLGFKMSEINNRYHENPTISLESTSFPCYLLFDRSGFLLIADKHKNRISRIDITKKTIVDIVVPEHIGLMHPFMICLQEKFDQLYVCEYGNSNTISVFDYNK